VGAAGMHVQSEDFQILAKQIREIVGENHILKDVHTALRETVKPTLTDIKSAALAIPSKGSAGRGGSNVRAAKKLAKPRKKARSAKSIANVQAKSGLRAAIAGAVGAQVNASSGEVVIRVFPGNLPPDQRGLPFLMNGDAPWRHPTFGHRPIVTQPSHQFFDSPIQQHLPRMIGEVEAVRDNFLDILGRG
jgi:hypothetical protein